MFKSIRWRLPLSYAAIALLVALVLGAVLLVTLRGYYAQQERGYLASNAQAISATVAQLIEAELSVEACQSQLDVFAFLSQAQVRVLDAEEQLVAASTAPEALNVSSAAVPVPGREAVLLREVGPGLRRAGPRSTIRRPLQGSPAEQRRTNWPPVLQQTGGPVGPPLPFL